MLHQASHLLTEGKHTGTMIALFLPTKVARKMAVKGGLPPSEMHVTVGYFGKDLTAEQKRKMVAIVREFSKQLGPVKATLGGVGRFSASKTSEGNDVAYLSVDSPALTNLRPKLIAKLNAAGIKVSQDHGYVPHVTLAYIGTKAKMPINRVEPISVEFDTITVAMGDRRTAIKLKGKHEHTSRFGSIIAEARAIIGPAKPMTVGTMPTPMMRAPVVGGMPKVQKLYKPRKPVSLLTKPTSIKVGI